MKNIKNKTVFFKFFCKSGKNSDILLLSVVGSRAEISLRLQASFRIRITAWQLPRSTPGCPQPGPVLVPAATSSRRVTRAGWPQAGGRLMSPLATLQLAGWPSPGAPGGALPTSRNGRGTGRGRGALLLHEEMWREQRTSACLACLVCLQSELSRVDSDNPPPASRESGFIVPPKLERDSIKDSAAACDL